MENTQKCQEIVGWIGTIAALFFGCALSMGVEYSPYAWIGTAMASALLVMWAVWSKQYHQLTLHGAYLLININGAVNYILL